MTLNTMIYEGYTARVYFNSEDMIFIGRVLGINDVISFHGETVAELTADFHNAIKHYLADCKRSGRKPEKPASGKLLLRIKPELHAAAAVKAEASGKSLNQWAAEALEEAVNG